MDAEPTIYVTRFTGSLYEKLSGHVVCESEKKLTDKTVFHESKQNVLKKKKKKKVYSMAPRQQNLSP